MMKNRVLVLSGGGHHGAFQVGVLKHLVNDLGFSYNKYLGVSVGAINAAYLSMFEESQAKKSVSELEKLWLSIETSDVRKRWCPFGVLHALWENAAYNSKPLKELIYKVMDEKKIRESGNHLKVGAASLKTGQYRLFDQDYPKLKDAVLASAAFPGVLLPIELEGELWIDGGVRNVTPIGDAIGMDADEIDVIMASPPNLEEEKKNPSNTLDVGLRSLSLLTDEITQTDIDIALLINELVLAGLRPDKKYVKINVYRPDKSLGGTLLEFEPEESKRLIEEGYRVAKKQNK